MQLVSMTPCLSAFAADGTGGEGVAENGRAESKGAVYDHQVDSCALALQSSSHSCSLPCTVVVRKAMPVRHKGKREINEKIDGFSSQNPLSTRGRLSRNFSQSPVVPAMPIVPCSSSAAQPML